MEKSCLLAYIENMRRDDVIAKLKETEPVLRGFGVAALYLFGSHARDEAGPDSDVDVFVETCRESYGLRRIPRAEKSAARARSC
jgi:predicted nucleotidyltransferase